jgi:hypothetical protein
LRNKRLGSPHPVPQPSAFPLKSLAPTSVGWWQGVGRKPAWMEGAVALAAFQNPNSPARTELDCRTDPRLPSQPANFTGLAGLANAGGRSEDLPAVRQSAASTGGHSSHCMHGWLRCFLSFSALPPVAVAVSHRGKSHCSTQDTRRHRCSRCNPRPFHLDHMPRACTTEPPTSLRHVSDSGCLEDRHPARDL